MSRNSTRRKFIYTGIGSLAVFSFFRFLRPSAKKPKTIKMLTEDGKLVEIDANLVPTKKSKIKDEEIFTWVKKTKISKKLQSPEK